MKLDHIAVSGETLEAATSHVEDALGVRLQPGGKHAKFGTHNNLLGLEGGLYLEAIAIDPTAPTPERTRWFDLDRFSGASRLSNWICRVDDIDAVQMPDGQVSVVDLNRGDLRWRMAVPESGRLPFDNLFPAFIQWQGKLHPARMLHPSGCRLRRLSVSHPDAAKLEAAVGALEFVDFHCGPLAMQAEFDTPHGVRVLE